MLDSSSPVQRLKRGPHVCAYEHMTYLDAREHLLSVLPPWRAPDSMPSSWA